jgi:hypothetical protein
MHPWTTSRRVLRRRAWLGFQLSAPERRPDRAARGNLHERQSPRGGLGSGHRALHRSHECDSRRSRRRAALGARLGERRPTRERAAARRGRRPRLGSPRTRSREPARDKPDPELQGDRQLPLGRCGREDLQRRDAARPGEPGWGRGDQRHGGTAITLLRANRLRHVADRRLVRCHRSLNDPRRRTRSRGPLDSSSRSSIRERVLWRSPVRPWPAGHSGHRRSEAVSATSLRAT